MLDYQFRRLEHNCDYLLVMEAFGAAAKDLGLSAHLP